MYTRFNIVRETERLEIYVPIRVGNGLQCGDVERVTMVFDHLSDRDNDTEESRQSEGYAVEIGVVP